MKKLWQLLIMSILATLLLVGCNGEEAAPVENSTDDTQQEATVEETAFPLTMTDVVGNEITLEEAPKTIVSMIPSNTEILFGLGLNAEIVGVNDYDNYPAEALEKEKIGGQEFNVEKIVAMNPDIVFAHESMIGVGEAGLQQIRDAGVEVFVVKNAADFNETYTTIEEIGRATGKLPEAQQIIEDMKAKVEEVKEKVASVETKKTVFVENSDVPDIYTAGNGTFMQEMFDMINAENIAADQEGWFKIEPEEIVSRNPDVMIISYSYVDDIINKVKARDGFDSVTAVKNDAVVQVDENLVSRTGPRLGEALEAIAKAVYPEVFSE
ncbi:iron complex transport system substrate-binding protein [Psychrobacillus insolitus]|uniref:Iron complex transport system substrate-binding protein n=1 Tax=Psychrobacillus insolitus TaxID=1461 RepID=A0A2W7MI63_9BACI|nr:ABC transporter substrate-binding protein [Psychrobacillus insolitus]PZX05841.1 iron complex transport system substrate-binding protein [Psychrobacillus insolitus]